MKNWQNPEIWQLNAEYTEGSLTGNGEDHVKVENPNGWDIWGSNPS